MLKRTAVVLAALALPGVASAQTLNIGLGGSVTSFDPHFFNAASNNAATLHVFERLIRRDEATRPQPGLALSWTAIGERLWEFKLRPGVTWTDGRPFTADDVVFSVGRLPHVPNSPGGFAGMTRGIARMEVVDPLTLRVHTPEPYPQLPVDFASFSIISRHVGEGATTEDYNSGRAAIGTGPYRLAAYRAGDRIEFTRNDAHWEPRQPWAAVHYRFIPNDATRTAALLSGDVDLIDQVPSTDLPRLRREARYRLAEAQGLRAIYLTLDRSRRGEVPGITDNAGQPLPRNPFDDLRVRRALSLAVNREALTDRIMEGTATPTGQWLPPGAFGYNPDIQPRFDPDAARRLLAEAGFPQGFRATLTSTSDRYPNDARVAQAVAQMWSRVGVQTQVNALPFAVFTVRSARQEFGIRLLGWSSSSGDASSALVNVIGSYDREARTGSNNQARYSNGALDALAVRALGTLDDARREAVFRDAVRLAMEDEAMLPLFMLINSWASRPGVAYTPRMDELTLAMGARPAN